MPAVQARIIAETERPPCRWAHTNGTTTYLSYKWGTNLQTPNTLYRNAFESSITDWNAVATKMLFSYSASGNITLSTYSVDDHAGGYAVPYCSGTATSSYNVFANTFYENSSTTVNKRRALTGHELGHSVGIGHIPGRDFISLMGNNPDGNTYYTPQQSDIDFINQFYP
jgi:hypothetical protein